MSAARLLPLPLQGEADMAQIDTKSTARAQQASSLEMASRFQWPPTQISGVDRRTPEDVAAIQRLTALMKRL